MGNSLPSGDLQSGIGTVGNAASIAIKGVTGVAVVAGSLNPVILPATAAVLFTVAVYFTLKGMHLRFISYLTTTVGQLKDMFFFIMLMQDIVRLMIEGAASDSIRGQIKGFNLHTKQFQNAIQLLNEVLKKFAPPSVQSDLRQDASLAEAPKTSFASRIKSATKNVFGVAYRFLNSSVLLKKVDRLFQNVIVAFQIMQARFFLLLNLHSETFNKIKGKFMEESEAFKNDQITDEGEGTLSRSFLDIASPFKDQNPPPPPEVKEKADSMANDVTTAPAAGAAGGARSRPKKRRLRKTLKRRVLGNWRRKLLKLLHGA